MGTNTPAELLDLGFFEEHMLADNRIILLLLELTDALRTLFVGGVEEASAGSGDELNEFTHGQTSGFFQIGCGGYQRWAPFAKEKPPHCLPADVGSARPGRLPR